MMYRSTAVVIRLLAVALFSCIISLSPAGAAFLRNVPQTVGQPDGTVIKCLASGDEHYNWLHDSDGYVIIKDPKTGFYVYANETTADLAPSTHVVGKSNPLALGLKKDARPAPKVLADKIKASRKFLAMPVRKSSNRNSLSYSSTGTISAPQTPSFQQINDIVIFIRFSDEPEFTDSVDKYDAMFNSSLPGANSMNNYFTEASYGQFSTTATFYPTPTGSTVLSYQDTNPRSYYQPYDATTNPNGYTGGEEGADRLNRENTLLANAVNTISSQVPAGLDVDTNNDGYVDSVCFIVDGPPTAWSTLLWPHTWALSTQTATIHDKQVSSFTLELQNITGVGVLCHEMCHILGAPDMYHYNYPNVDPIYAWGIMDYDTDPPQHMSSYLKYRYMHWIASVPEITATGTYTLNSLISPTGNCYKIASPQSSTEYYWVEYRHKIGTFESSLLDSGLLVYRVNTAVDGLGNENGPPDELYLYRPNGTTTENGMPANAAFSMNTGRTKINDNTNPSGFLSDGSPGGLSIYNIGAVGNTISFSVDMFGVATPTFTPDGGTFGTQQSVTIACATPGAIIHYTTNGNVPTKSDPTVTGPIVVNHSLTLKAKAWTGGIGESDVKSADFYLMGTPSAAKQKPDNTLVGIVSSVVTAVFGDIFYIESDSRAAGLAVYLPNHGLTAGMRVILTGTMSTTSAERILLASSATQDGAGVIKPFFLSSTVIGGANWMYNPVTGAGQCGVSGANGLLNNVGLLVTLFGRARSLGTDTFYLDDGSGKLDDSGNIGLRVLATGLTLPQADGFVKVTGISSIYTSGTLVYPVLKVAGQENIVPME